jgi:hypothetical protein
VYSLGVSEEITGRALKEYGPSRDKLVIATKVFNAMGDDPNQQGLSRKHIMHAIDDSLRRLQTDYVDLYQIHRFDPHTPIEETLEALDQVVRSGKALYIGASSMYAWQFLKMLQTSDMMGLARFVTMQNHYNLVYREEEREMIPLCLEEGVGLIPGVRWRAVFWPETGIRKPRGNDSRKDRRFCAKALLPSIGLHRGGPADRNCDQAGGPECTGGFGLDPGEARGKLTHHRRQQDGAPGSGDRCAENSPG